MTRWFRASFVFCAIALTSLCFAVEQTSISPDEDNSNEIRPTGVPHRQRAKTKASPAADSDSNAHTAASATPRTRRARRAPRQRDSDDESFSAQSIPGSIPKTSAVSVIVINAASGQVLYEKNADALRAPASTTKLLTGLIVAETGNLDRQVVVAQTDTLAEPVKLNIKPGDTYTRIDLLRALLVKSPNDVARCLARDNAGSIEAFAEKMNQRAVAAGARSSHWVNPNGLPDARQYSTARDLSSIARIAYANPLIRSIVCLPQLNFRYANGRTRELESTNKLLKKLPYCNGMKTGYTEAAGKCLIASGSSGSKNIIVVVLGDSHSGVWRDAGNLLAWALFSPSAG
ncbi:MAG TPA: D-alanyl-D-alanine carboxypeptidase family protein [Chthoniobacterales bacterium]|nr:D-alanyl-D-alanine carboxypeptidase family protein [Chthoniobacterales bacterium]